MKDEAVEHTGMAASPPRSLSGAALIADMLGHVPRQPGVYRMNDQAGAPIYIGKARDLQARVGTYARLEGHTRRISHMISLIASVEFVVTRNETEALLLEANFITRLQPRFNILLRDDKSFPSIFIRRDHSAPAIRKHRGAQRVKGEYYGPFASAAAVDRALKDLQKAFLLRTCSDSVYAGRSRACLLYQIKRCAGPCVGHITLEAYENLAVQAGAFLRGKGDSIHKALSREMEAAADDRNYEEAARLRDRIRALSAIRESQSAAPSGIKEADVFAIVSRAGRYCVQAFFIRHGQNRGAASYFPKAHDSDGQSAVFAAFLSQFYHSHACPRHVLISDAPDDHALLAAALTDKAGHAVTIAVPQRGIRHDVVQWARTNAEQALAQKLADAENRAAILASLAEVFGLAGPPQRIETYDNSHIQGTNAVGAMIVANADGFDKSSYRLFTIARKETTPGDDYAMIKEVISRRFARLQQADDHAAWPDLILIDGGEGHLRAARTALDALGIGAGGRPHLLAIAKGADRNAGHESFHMEGRRSFRLPDSDPVLYYLQRLRDEAHRFAISAHRRRRSRAQAGSPLDGVAGVGRQRKKALLHRFGSARAVARASLADLRSTDGISEEIAGRIYAHFHG